MSGRRVLHCIPGMGGGGAERQLAYLAGELVRIGWDVHVAFVREGPNFERLRNSGATLHRLQARNNYDPRLFTQLLDTIERVAPDVIQVWVLQMEVLGAIAARIKGVPWILSERCSEPAYPATIKHRLRVGIAGRTSAVVSNSAGGDAYWRARLAANVPRYIIPNALPIDEIERTPAACDEETALDPGQQLVLFAGRLTDQKNPHGLIRALIPVLARPRIAAVLAGDGPMRDVLKTLVQEHRLDDRMRLLGFIPNIWAWMKRASVFVSPTFFEGHPNAVLEAMASGCPLVVSDIPPHREFLDEGSAVLVAPDEPAQLTAAILDVLSNPGPAASRARQAARTARQWSIEHMAGEYDRVYREVLASRLGAEGVLR